MDTVQLPLRHMLAMRRYGQGRGRSGISVVDILFARGTIQAPRIRYGPSSRHGPHTVELHNEPFACRGILSHLHKLCLEGEVGGLCEKGFEVHARWNCALLNITCHAQAAGLLMTRPSSRWNGRVQGASRSVPGLNRGVECRASYHKSQ